MIRTRQDHCVGIFIGWGFENVLHVRRGTAIAELRLDLKTVAGAHSTHRTVQITQHASNSRQLTAHTAQCTVHPAHCIVHTTHHTVHSACHSSANHTSHVTQHTVHITAVHIQANQARRLGFTGSDTLCRPLTSPPQYVQVGPFSPTCKDTSNVIWGVVFSSWPQQQTGNVQCRRLILGGLYVRLHACTTPFDLNWQCRTKVHKCKNTNKYKNKGPADAYLWENSEDPCHIWHFSVPLFC